MYITPRQKKRYVIGFVFVALAIPLTVIAAYFAAQIVSNAGAVAVPTDLVISNTTTNAATITWTTDVDANVSVKVDSTGDVFTDPRGATSRQTHFVELTNLDPDTEYTFTIKSNDDDYTAENGINFKLSTAPITDQTPVPSPVYGNVSGIDEDDAVIFIVVTSPEPSLPISAVPPPTGNWILDLSSLRKLDGSENISSVGADAEMKILVIASNGKGAVLSGSKSELFGDDGKLEDSITLEVTDGVDVMASMPEEAKLAETIAIDPTPEPDPVPDPTPVPTPTPTPDPIPEPEPEPSFDPANREFLLALDIDWENLVLGASTVTPPDITTGANSIQIVNHTDTSFSFVWLSSSSEEGYVAFGTSAADMSEEGIDVRDSIANKSSYRSHLVELDDLLPGTTYYYQIYSGDQVLAQVNSLDTFATLSSPPPFDTASGVITGLDSYDDVVVTLQIDDTDTIGSSGRSGYGAVVPDSTGAWIASIGDIRDNDGSEYYSYTDTDTLTTALVTYAISTPVESATINLGTTEIAMSAEEIAGTSTYQRVAILDDYGVYTTYLEVGLSVGGGGTYVSDPTNSAINPNAAATTPKTAVSTSFVLSIVAGVSAVTVAVVMALRGLKSNDRKVSNNKMSTSL